ncbi:Trypanosomal VSG domain containing protein, putative [Trypanosoma equiperdum]|uniref:Trypanosomal VSG domain containing protein, putative n=1 Tax=Trypanosoma equiperdum TaxID=5694 RepID=A0A1G4ICR7_TRYEQ|nr:Trypanosomal VSG domain containing protein, putative [Trypanosoma equiperdum]
MPAVASNIAFWRFAAVALCAITSEFQGAANDNAAEFRAMCDIYNLEVNPGVFSPPQANSEVAKIVTELETLNLSAASDVWFEDKEGELSDKNGKDNADARTTWQKEKEKLNKKPGSDGQPKYKRLPDTWQRKQAASALKRLLKSATDLSNEYSSTIGGAEVRVQRVQTALTNALYGKGKTRLDTAVLTSDLKSYCGKAAGSPAAGTGIAYDFICLCTATDSNSAGEGNNNKQSCRPD